MRKSLTTTTLEHLGTRLHEQVLEVAMLRLALDIQSRRIAKTLADRDGPPHGGSRPQSVPAPVTQTSLTHRNGLGKVADRNLNG